MASIKILAICCDTQSDFYIEVQSYYYFTVSAECVCICVSQTCANVTEGDKSAMSGL